MYTVSLSYKNNTKQNIMSNNKSEYYMKLIIRQTLKCLNSNCISYIARQNAFSKVNFPKIDANIILTTISNNKLIPYNRSGIQVFFKAGNPKSKRLATIMAENLKNIYYASSSVTMHPLKKEEPDMQKDNIAYVHLEFGYSSKKDTEWIKENTEEISQNIIISLTEYFGLPFVACIKPFPGMTKSDSNIFSKPSTKSKIVGYITKNKKTEIQGQWESWYIIGKNNDLGYIPAKFIEAFNL